MHWKNIKLILAERDFKKIFFKLFVTNFFGLKVTFGAHSKDIFYYCLVNILNSYLSNDTKHLYSVFQYFFLKHRKYRISL